MKTISIIRMSEVLIAGHSFCENKKPLTIVRFGLIDNLLDNCFANILHVIKMHTSLYDQKSNTINFKAIVT